MQEDSDFEEGEMVEGKLNSAQKKRLKHDLMAMGYEDEEDDLEDSPSSPEQQQDFDAQKKLFAAQMRAEILGGGGPKQ